MATNNNKSVAEAKSKKKEPQEGIAVESVYTADELAKAHKVFDTSYEIVAVALKLAGKEAATVTEAKEIINEFMKKEVK